MELFANFFRQEIFSNLNEMVIVFALILSRVFGFVHAAPIFSHKSVTPLSKIAMSLFLAFIMVDALPFESPPEIGYSLLFSVFINVLLGILIGFIANLMFHTVVAGGEMMDSSMGFSSGQMFDPATGHQTTIIGRFMGMLGIVVFFAVGGPEMLIQGLYNSFESFGLYNPNIQLDFHRIIGLTGDIIKMGFLIVSPVVLTILVTDLVLGLVSRAAPQINAFQISFTIKPSVGSIVLILTLPLLFTVLSGFFTSPSRLF